ncbi:hypothetical protein MSPP1_003182 [Malassezia sp. CBS 17886]|nr:hypothetical protein MSPP1_003182 [Malassezia sp. CBS 17886]
MAESPAQVLGQGVGWAVVAGLGFSFAAFMMFITFLQNRLTTRSTANLEEFNSAGHSVKPGLIAAGIVSAWTWAATLLQSTTVTFKYGVSGAYWYGAGATLQILFCSIMACKIKSCAPFCSTYLEIIRVRYGKPTHAVFICFALLTNLLVSSQLVLGGAAVVTELTGLNVFAGIFLIPASVAAYTVTGGLRATFIADYSHTIGLFVVIIYFFFHIWTGNGKIGSLGHMTDLLTASAARDPVPGNAGGSYLTMRSQSGLIFGIINICGNLATVFCDQSYHQRSIASLPSTASRGFLLGGSAWFPIPFLFATSLGLTARALFKVDPDMAGLTQEQVTAGLSAPSAAVALCGKGGAVAVLIMLFLAVTSAMSAQQIAVSSVFTFDLYKVYVVSHAHHSHFQLVSHGAVVVWSLIMSVFGVIWHFAGIELGWLYLMMGIIVAPGVGPIFLSIVWKNTNRLGCVVGMVTGLVLGIFTWLITAYGCYNEVTVATTNEQYPTLAGNLVSLLVSIIIVVTWSIASPQNYDFAATRAYNAPKDLLAYPDVPVLAKDAPSQEEESPEPEKDASVLEKEAPTDPSQDGACAADADPETNDTPAAAAVQCRDGGEANIEYVRAAGLDPSVVTVMLRKSVVISLVSGAVLVIVIPAVATSARIWNSAGLGAWMWLGFLWLMWSIYAVGVLPILEEREALMSLMSKMGSVFKRRKPA